MRNRNITIYSTLLFVTALASCRMGKDYQRPDLGLPAQFASVAAPSDSSVADMEWKKFFSDPTLQSLIGHALQNSFDAQLKIARHNVSLGDTIVRVIKLQKQAGQVTELAIQQATAQQQTAALLVPQIEQQIAIQENTLRILSGDLPGTVTRNIELNSL